MLQVLSFLVLLVKNWPQLYPTGAGACQGLPQTLSQDRDAL